MLFFTYKLPLKIAIIALIFCYSLNAQVVFREPSGYKLTTEEHLFFGITDSRHVILLDGMWNVFTSDTEREKKVSVNVPSVFEGEAELIFEREFSISRSDLINNSFELVFLGLNYRADISINEIIIYRHAGGEFPFSIELTRDMLKSGAPNVLSVRLFYQLDSRTTIPLKQRYLFAKNFGGIVHDVYLYKKPAININKQSTDVVFNETSSVATIKIKTSVVDNSVRPERLSSDIIENLFLRTVVKDPNNIVLEENTGKAFNLERKKEHRQELQIKINDPVLWSPDRPGLYSIRIELWQEDNLIDVLEQTKAIYDIQLTDDAIKLNHQDFKFIGTTYIPEFGSFGDLVNYDQFEKDLKLIKDTGFNAIRISKIVPHPYILYLCDRYGLFAFIELPIGMLPSKISQDPNFAERCSYFLSSYISAYKRYSSVVTIGLGSSYLYAYDSHRSLLSNLAEQVKANTNWIVFASFGNLTIDAINNVDMYGIELLNQQPADIAIEISELQTKLGQGRIFISEATYTVNSGNTDGYINKYSYEAQAKYYSDLIDYSENNFIAGYFINSISDIIGNYSSLLFGYDGKNTYRFGLLSESRSSNRISYKVVSSKLNNTEKVTIPIGSSKDDAPMVFILFGLLLALFMGVLVNSGKKFREDASRALLRPYNYYADVRDQRIMSPYHTAFLAVIIVIVNALVISNVLFYLKTNVVFEKLLLSFGSPVLLDVANYLCWNPFNSIVWITMFGILFLLILTLLIKFASLFIRQRVYLVSVYFAVIWAFLPMVFLIPLGIVLYRVLIADVVNSYIYISLIILGIWVIYRLLKGVYVIFDTTAGAVYFYSLIFILFIFGGIMAYYEINNAAIQYLLFTLKQYNIIG